MLEPSKYLPYFQENAETLRAEMSLLGDTLVVERLTFPEQRVGKIILSDSKQIQTNGFTTEMPQFFRVLWVGAGYYDDNKDVPLEVKPGDIIHTAAASVKLWSSFPILESSDSGILGLTRYGDTIAKWESEEAFVRFLTGFNIRFKAEVEKRKTKFDI